MKNLINFMKENGIITTVWLLLVLPMIILMWALMIRLVIGLFA